MRYVLEGSVDTPVSGQPPGTMLVSGSCCHDGHTDMGGLFCHWGHGDIQADLMPRAMSGSVVLLQLRSVMMSMADVSRVSHRNHKCGYQMAVLSQSHPWLAQGWI